jgi:hypothetical protein
MKFRNSFLVFLGFALLFSLSSCEGDEGPIGPAGPTGSTGPQGPAGVNGAENCMDCHSNSQLITAKMFQWEHSAHAIGGHYDRNATNCAVCHTSQGYLERIAANAETTSAAIQDPLPLNCYTCHKIHQSYSQDDWALTKSDPVTFWLGGETADVGKGNLCISCHQARKPSPALPDPATGGTITITSSRYGPHHGAQGMMFTGSAGYELNFGTPYENSVHTTLIQDACVTCHMATAVGTQSGGHTFNVASESGAINTAGCVACHADVAALNTLTNDTQAEITNLLGELKAKLVERGLLNPDTDLAIVPQDFEGHEAGALFNYKYVEEDQSLGVHNYKYTRALLLNSIAALQ